MFTFLQSFISIFQSNPRINKTNIKSNNFTVKEKLTVHANQPKEKEKREEIIFRPVYEFSNSFPNALPKHTLHVLKAK
jgi:hypothetical protein